MASGEYRNLVQYDFGALLMGRTIDMLEEAFIKISSDDTLLLDEDIMINIFRYH
jgi:hypothetical protein